MSSRASGWLNLRKTVDGTVAIPDSRAKAVSLQSRLGLLRLRQHSRHDPASPLTDIAASESKEFTTSMDKMAASVKKSYLFRLR